MRQSTKTRKTNISREPISPMEDFNSPIEKYTTPESVIQLDDPEIVYNPPIRDSVVSEPRTRRNVSRFKIFLGFFVFIGVVFVGRGKYAEYQIAKDPQAIAQAEIKKLIEDVGKLIVLPTDEQPTIATVSDLEKLKGQEFFAHAETGDKVLLYSKARKAILYSPSRNKIVEMAPINLPTLPAEPKISSTKK
jgi:hypothetical protein